MRRRQLWAARAEALKVQEAVQAIQAANPPQRIPADLSPGACPKCGRAMTRGLTMHMRFCKGGDE